MDNKVSNNKNTSDNDYIFIDFKNLMTVVVIVLVLFVLVYFIFSQFKKSYVSDDNEIKQYDYQSIMENYSSLLSIVSNERIDNDESYSYDEVSKLIDFPFSIKCAEGKISYKSEVYLYDCSIDNSSDKYSIGYDFDKEYNTYDKSIDIYILKDEYGTYFSDTNDLNKEFDKYTLDCLNKTCSIAKNQNYNKKYIILKESNYYSLYNYLENRIILNGRKYGEIKSINNMEDIFIVRKGTKEALYDASKEEFITKFSYNKIGGQLKFSMYKKNTNDSINNSVVLVKNKNKFGLLNANNNSKVLDIKYDDIKYYKGIDYYILITTINNISYISRLQYNNKITNSNGPYEYVYGMFDDEYYAVLKNNLITIVDKSGSIIYNFEFPPESTHLFYVYSYLDTIKILLKDDEINNKCTTYTYSISKGSNITEDDCYKIK